MLKASYIKMRLEGEDDTKKKTSDGLTILIDAYKSKKWKIYNYIVKRQLHQFKTVKSYCIFRSIVFWRCKCKNNEPEVMVNLDSLEISLKGYLDGSVV